MHNDDYEEPSVSDYSEPVARKEYECEQCFSTIKVGEKYARFRGLFAGEWETQISCLPCMTLRNKLDTNAPFLINYILDTYSTKEMVEDISMRLFHVRRARETATREARRAAEKALQEKTDNTLKEAYRDHALTAESMLDCVELLDATVDRLRLSCCCSAVVAVAGKGDSEGATRWFECTTCGKPCDVIIQ